ncbi:MAG: alpha/beta fold hydrolase [Candidatus Eremiobacteraeota bacterium]|nr:alpha/beta fold hydrolase [Candidatus Eremiobacteraeota bacterium]
MLQCLIAGTLCSVIGAVAATPAPSPLAKAKDALVAGYPVAQQRLGEGPAASLLVRVLEDLDEISQPAPSQFSAEAWQERLQTVSRLDASFVTDLLSGTTAPVTNAPGLTEHLMRSRVDGTLQPFALYVPPGADANSSLVVLLHGRPQTETELIGEPYFRELAAKTKTVVVVPWGRDHYDFAPPADDDVYQALDAVQNALGLSPRRAFLVGYSMGGFSVFTVGPLHADRWAAIMCVSGAVLNSEVPTVRWRFRETPVYVVTGAVDENIPTVYGEETAAYLASIGLTVSFYEQPGGTHYLGSLMPALTSAWTDMLAGTIHPPNGLSVGTLPLAAPTMSHATKP